MAQETLSIKIDEKGALVVKRDIEGIGKSAKATGGALSLLKKALGALAAATVIKQFIALADSFTTLQNKLKLVTNGTDNLRGVTQELFDISRRTGASFEETSNSFSKFALSAKELGRSQGEILEFTELVNKAVILGGSSTTEAAGGLRQLAQGIASGALRGDELISVLENLPFVADIIAKSLKVTRGELRDMGKQGKITAEIVLDAFRDNADFLNTEYRKTQVTIGQGFVAIKNSLLLVVGQFSESEGIGLKFAEALLKASEAVLVLGKHTDTLTVAIASLAVTIGTVKFLAWAQAASGATSVIGALTFGVSALKTATTALLTSLGPVGAILIAAGVAATAATLYFEKLKNIEEEINAIEDRIYQDRLARVQAQVLEIKNRNAAEQALKDYITQLEEEQRLISIGKRNKGIEESLAKAAFAAKRDLTDIEKERVIGIFDLTEALKQNKEMLESIRKPQTDYAEKLATLERIKPELGVIEHADALARLNEEYGKSDTIGTFLKSLEQETKLLRANSTERAIQLELLKLADDKGSPLTAPEEKQARSGLDTIQPLREEASLLERILGPQKSYAENLKALNSLREKGLITEQQFNQERLKSNAVLNTLDALRDEAVLLRLSGDERERRAEILQLENALLQQGATLQPDDKGEAERLIAENQALKRQGDLLASIVGPEQARVQALKDLEAIKPELTATQYTDALAGLQSTLNTVTQSQQILGDTITAVFDAGFDQLHNFTSGGKVLFSEFASAAVDSITEIIGAIVRMQAIKAVSTAFGLPGLAQGGTILPGGGGGTDSQIVAFRKSPDERVDVRTPAQVRAGRSMAGPPPAAAPNFKFVNVLDPALIREAMADEEGTQTIMNTLQRNKTTANRALS